MHHFNLVIYYDILITYFEKLLIINPLRAWPVGKRHFPQYLEHAMSSGVARECRGPSRAKGSNVPRLRAQYCRHLDVLSALSSNLP
jgi:hypothetical protein